MFIFFKYRNIHTQNLKYITALDKRKIKNEMNSSIVSQWKSHTHIQTRKCVWVEENYNCKKGNKIWHSSSQKYRNVKITTKSVVDSKQLYNKKEKVKQKVESSGNRAAAYELTKEAMQTYTYFISWNNNSKML